MKMKPLCTCTNSTQPFDSCWQDGSGFITFDEFCKVIRTKLRVKKEQLTDRNIKTLWSYNYWPTSV